MFVVNVPYLDLDQIYASGQVFSWKKVQPGCYIIYHREKVVKVTQKRQMFSFTCSEEDFYNIWWWYFDLVTDYMELHYMYRVLGDEFKVCCNRGNGIHILNQDLFEVIITSYLRYYLNQKDVYDVLKYIRLVCGRKHKNTITGSVIIWNEFPKPQDIVSRKRKLLQGNYPDVLDGVVSIAQDIVEGWLDLEFVKKLSDGTVDDVIEYLTECVCINNSIAQYICLYGLHMFDVFPSSGIVNEFLTKTFDMDFYEWFDWYICGEVKLVKHMGYIREVLMYNMVNPITDTNYDYITTRTKQKYRKVKRRK